MKNLMQRRMVVKVVLDLFAPRSSGSGKPMVSVLTVRVIIRGLRMEKTVLGPLVNNQKAAVSRC
jgi:hypothetical protein